MWGTAQYSVSGIVTDSLTKMPVAQVSVLAESANLRTVTNESGNFILTGLPEGPVVLIFSHIALQERRISLSILKNVDSLSIVLSPLAHTLSDIFITADRQERNTRDIPSAIYSVSGMQAQVYPVNNTDELLSLIPGIRIDRDRGIFSKNSSISMRGLNGSARTLVLLDGAPINKADGAGINWSRIDPDIIERIEVMKGPNSTIYGSNAMGGVVNIVTSRNPGLFRARVKTFYGTFHTQGGNISASGAKIRNNRGFYWAVNSFYRKGDGYIPVVDSLIDSLDVKTYLKEMNAGIRLGYQFSSSGSLEVAYDYYWDKRGDGTMIYEPGGSYNQYPSNCARLKYQASYGNWQVIASGFYQQEHYQRQNETIKKQTGKYTLYRTDSRRTDAGLWLTGALRLPSERKFTMGVDLKKGSVDASDIYYSSTDILRDRGNMDLGSVFAQLESPVITGHLRLEAGLRFDIAKFYNGSFTINDPTALTEFMTGYPTEFHDTSWIALSPRIAILFSPTQLLKTYLSWSHGFRPPTLDDMCRNGNITKGFKLANPALGPEHLNNFEAGYTLMLYRKFTIDQSVFYSLGKDFQYFVASGDSVYTGGNNLKPVLQRQNISKARIDGTEVSVNYQLTNTLLGFANYAYSHSMLHPDIQNSGSSSGLEGKMLMEVPAHQASFGIEWRYKWFMAGTSLAYTGKVYADDDNLVFNPARTETGIRLSANYDEKIYLGFSIQDVFNHRYIDNKGNISPGRYLLTSLIWKIGANQQ
jgi:outer membrane receptor protein involved in Fe transport